MEALCLLNFLLAAAFAACYAYQAVYVGARLLGRGRRAPETNRRYRYGVLIAARNEEAVIGQLLESIAAQDYPQELLSVFVVADNCTDATAQVARSHGATVFQRQNALQVGKGYALAYLLERIGPQAKDFAGFFVFDADNLLDPRYVAEMNKVFAQGERVITSYRNTKNFGDNWLSACSGLWFLRESEYLNRPRDCLGASATVAGTGFLFARETLEELGGWQYFLLTEDAEFTADLLTHGGRVAYCRDAVFYDEQPTGFAQSVTQRSRWIKGMLQVYGRYGGRLIRSAVAEGRFGCYDLLMNTLPAVLATAGGALVNAAMAALVVLSGGEGWQALAFSLLWGAAGGYGVTYLMGALPLVTEWKRIRCPAGKKVLYSLAFPLYVFSYALAGAVAVFGNVTWKPIRHTAALSIADVTGEDPPLS